MISCVVCCCEYFGPWKRCYESLVIVIFSILHLSTMVSNRQWKYELAAFKQILFHQQAFSRQNRMELREMIDKMPHLNPSEWNWLLMFDTIVQLVSSTVHDIAHAVCDIDTETTSTQNTKNNRNLMVSPIECASVFNIIQLNVDMFAIVRWLITFLLLYYVIAANLLLFSTAYSMLCALNHFWAIEWWRWRVFVIVIVVAVILFLFFQTFQIAHQIESIASQTSGRLKITFN